MKKKKKKEKKTKRDNEIGRAMKEKKRLKIR